MLKFIFCLFLLVYHYRSSVRVWMPGMGSIMVRSRPGRSVDAYHMLLMAGPTDRPKAASYNSQQWLPVKPLRSGRHVTIGGTSAIEVPTTDYDTDSRCTDDESPMRKSGLQNGRAARVRRGADPGPVRPTKRQRRQEDSS